MVIQPSKVSTKLFYTKKQLETYCAVNNIKNIHVSLLQFDFCPIRNNFDFNCEKAVRDNIGSLIMSIIINLEYKTLLRVVLNYTIRLEAL